MFGDREEDRRGVNRLVQAGVVAKHLALGLRLDLALTVRDSFHYLHLAGTVIQNVITFLVVPTFRPLVHRRAATFFLQTLTFDLAQTRLSRTAHDQEPMGWGASLSRASVVRQLAFTNDEATTAGEPVLIVESSFFQFLQHDFLIGRQWVFLSELEREASLFFEKHTEIRSIFNGQYIQLWLLVV